MYLKAFSMGCLCICKISYLLRSHILLFFNMQRIRHAHGLIHHQSLSCSLDVFMWRFETSHIYAMLQLIKIYQPAIGLVSPTSSARAQWKSLEREPLIRPIFLSISCLMHGATAPTLMRVLLKYFEGPLGCVNPVCIWNFIAIAPVHLAILADAFCRDTVTNTSVFSGWRPFCCGRKCGAASLGGNSDQTYWLRWPS